MNKVAFLSARTSIAFLRKTCQDQLLHTLLGKEFSLNLQTPLASPHFLLKVLMKLLVDCPSPLLTAEDTDQRGNPDPLKVGGQNPLMHRKTTSPQTEIQNLFCLNIIPTSAGWHWLAGAYQMREEKGKEWLRVREFPNILLTFLGEKKRNFKSSETKK